ncbi:hypothetical protein NQZ68_006188 [Dissostichus eleginoides]|nr:hypothetical protein NQZ68_006188 [Dissostichus eleginoides]
MEDEVVGDAHEPQCGRHTVRVLPASTRGHITLSGVTLPSLGSHFTSSSCSTPQQPQPIIPRTETKPQLLSAASILREQQTHYREGREEERLGEREREGGEKNEGGLRGLWLKD